jgi:tetratricopeptide (TPR) repeat protein
VYVIALIAGFIGLLPALAQERPVPRGYKEQGPVSLTPGGQRLDKEDVARLERQLAENPNNIQLRRQLMTHYAKQRTGSARAARLEHITWIIANQPASRIAGTPLCRVDRNSDPEGYERARSLWLEQVNAQSGNAAVIGNAAYFMIKNDQQIAEDLLNMCRAVNPKHSQCAKLLATISTLKAAAERMEEEAPDPKVEALANLERTYELTEGRTERQLLLPEMGRAAFEAGDYDKAESYANQALEAVDDLQRDEIHGDALHHGHSILGRIALMNGQVTRAKQHLLEAGRTPGSPALESFGPSMSLAKGLLEAGETEVVLEYFQLCREFWKYGEQSLTAWTDVINEGGIPDFGSNL